MSTSHSFGTSEEWTEPKLRTTTILDEASLLVFGLREEDYGHPKIDAARVVGVLNALYADRLKTPFEPRDHAIIMLAVKLGRLMQGNKRDTMTDIAGYAEVLARIVGQDP